MLNRGMETNKISSSGVNKTSSKDILATLHATEIVDYKAFLPAGTSFLLPSRYNSCVLSKCHDQLLDD